jgi:capsular exopolysaccharide synthesis family protein
MTDTLNLLDYLRPLRRWWWLLGAAVAVALVATFLYMARQPAVYVSQATILVGSSIENPNPNGSELYLASQLAETYTDIASRAPLRQAVKEALQTEWLPLFAVTQVGSRPVLQVQVSDVDPQRAFVVAEEIVRQIILLGPKEEQDRQLFVDQQLSKLQTSIAETEVAIQERENELLTIDSARELANKQAEIRALQEKLVTLQQNYTDLLATTQRGAANALRILEPPDVPTEPLESELATNLAVAAVLAFALAAGGAYLLDYLDNSFRDPEELKRTLEGTLLGSVPTFPTAGEHMPPSATLLQLGRTSTGEAYRRIRTNLEFTAVDRSVRTILVSSPQIQDGKSTTAAHLCVTLASAGKRVVLVDADLHRPTQQRIFGLPNHTGLTTALLAEAINLEKILQPTIIPNLSLVTSGPLPPNPAELLGTHRFHEILAALRASADMVVIDSPPLAAVVDGLILATQVDGLVVVVRFGKTYRDTAKRALSALRQLQAHVLGLVFADVPDPHMDFYGQGYGYYSAGYGRSSEQAETSRALAGRGWRNRQELHPTGHAESLIHPSTGQPGTQQKQGAGVYDPTAGSNMAHAVEPPNGVPAHSPRRRPGLPWK